MHLNFFALFICIYTGEARLGGGSHCGNKGIGKGKLNSLRLYFGTRE